MSGKYPHYETYRELYLRFFQGRDVSELLDLLEPFSGMRVLDLCCGQGQLTLGALSRGAMLVISVDAESAMIPDELRMHAQVEVMEMNANAALAKLNFYGRRFDRVVCRQAINYWLNANTAKLIATAMASGGIFVFNTFNHKPTEKPRVLEYELEGHAFTEVSWLVAGTVHHVQVRDGLAPHYTTFAWLSSEHIRELLEPHFTVSEQTHDKTSIYRCVKR